MVRRAVSLLSLVVLVAFAPLGATGTPGAAEATNAETTDAEALRTAVPGNVLAAPCPDPVMVPGQGPSCRDGDLWRLQWPDGTEFLTHGPDPAPTTPPFVDSGEAPAEPDTAAAAPADPHCVEDPTEPHIQVIYAHPSDMIARYTTVDNESLPSSQVRWEAYLARLDGMPDTIRQLVRNANGIVRAEGASLDAPMDLRVRCHDGVIDVAYAPLATPSSHHSFLTITSELRARGFASTHAKYWVWYDGRVAGIGGQGNLVRDDRPEHGNANNKGPYYALTYGYTSTRIMLHELGHNLGAVQTRSPNSSGAGHCNDGRDIMCYNDGGPFADYSSGVCPVSWPGEWDCNNDDYFHPRPAKGSWLWDHWNLASGLSDFMEHEGPACEAVRGEVTAYTDDDGVVRGETVIAIPPICQGRHYTLINALTSNFDICWYAEGVELSCDEAPGRKTGAVPDDADEARIWITRDAGFFSLSMN